MVPGLYVHIGDCFAPFDGRSYVRLKTDQDPSETYGDKGKNEEEEEDDRRRVHCLHFIGLNKVCHTF